LRRARAHISTLEVAFVLVRAALDPPPHARVWVDAATTFALAFARFVDGPDPMVPVWCACASLACALAALVSLPFE
jgi:hypothetical protein